MATASSGSRSTRPVDGLTATSGDRTVMVAAPWFNAWEPRGRFDQDRWYVIDDRGIYRPGETVRVTGLVRELTADDAAARRSPAVRRTIRYAAFDAQGAELGGGTTELNALGGFNFALELTEAANSGPANIGIELVTAPDSTDVRSAFGHQFQIQDFRTPEYEVTARTESPAPYYVVRAGHGRGRRRVLRRWTARRRRGQLVRLGIGRPPTTRRTGTSSRSASGRRGGTAGFFDEDEVFGDFGFAEPCFDCGPEFGDPRFQEFVGRTDASGTHLLQIDFDDIPTSSDPDAEPEPVDQPTSVTAEATVFDVNRQAISSRTATRRPPGALLRRAAQRSRVRRAG